MKTPEIFILLKGNKKELTLIKMMNLSETYKKRLQELAGVENNEKLSFYNIVGEISKRVPFLKSYNRFDKERTDATQFQKEKCFGQKTLMHNNNPMRLSSICAFSELYISYRHFNEKKWYYVQFKNEIIPHISKDADVDELFRVVFMKAMAMQNEKFKFSKEIMINENEELPQEKIEEIVNELNKKTFGFEEYLNNTYKEQFHE